MSPRSEVFYFQNNLKKMFFNSSYNSWFIFVIKCTETNGRLCGY